MKDLAPSPIIKETQRNFLLKVFMIVRNCDRIMVGIYLIDSVSEEEDLRSSFSHSSILISSNTATTLRTRKLLSCATS